ncbi:MAG: hypothetical protein AAGU27_00430 [Dehalobacterium sp.]
MIKEKFAQRPTLNWIRNLLLVDFVDLVTEPGADKVLSAGSLDVGVCTL